MAIRCSRASSRGLMDALGDSSTDSASRLAAFSGFDPIMLEEAASAYSATNQLLRQRGILPDFKRSYGAPVQAPRRGVQSAPAESAPMHASGGIGGAASGSAGS